MPSCRLCASLCLAAHFVRTASLHRSRRAEPNPTAAALLRDVWQEEDQLDDGWGLVQGLDPRDWKFYFVPKYADELPTSPRDDCEVLSAGNEFADNVPIPNASACSLAIINAGMPRSGSTLAQMIVSMAVKDLLPGHKVFSTYWNLHHHVALDKNSTGEFLSKQASKLRGIVPHGVLIAKFHEVYTPLLGACAKTLVLTTHRHPVDIANSIMQAGWAPGGEGLLSRMQYVVRRQECWMKLASGRILDVGLEDYMLDDLRKLAKRIYKWVATEMKVPPPDEDAFADRVNRRYFHREANSVFPKSRSKNCSIPHEIPECLHAAVRDIEPQLLPAVGGYVGRYGYK